MRQELLDRLVCAKYLFEAGADLLERSAPYAAGLAVLNFHDAVELFLRTVGEDVGASIKERASLSEAMDEIDKASSKTLPYRVALSQLNRVRVQFKHAGLAPRDDVARKLRGDVEGFFLSVFPTYVLLEYHEVSLVSLVKHRRCANWIRKAEKFLANDRWSDSVEASATAFAIYASAQRTQSHHRSLERIMRQTEPRGQSKNPIQPGVYDLAKAVEKRLESLDEQLDWLSLRIDREGLRQFDDLTPTVNLAVSGKLWSNETRSRESTEADAVFCCNFVLDTVLKLQNRYQPESRFEGAWRRFRVLEAASIVLHLDGSTIEEIRKAEVGETLRSYATENHDSPGTIAVLQDGDTAYISADAVEEITGL
jgi:hypothetical protein